MEKNLCSVETSTPMVACGSRNWIPLLPVQFRGQKERVISSGRLVLADESIAYRGRIDNFYADYGKPRRMVTEHDLRDALDAVLTGKAVEKPSTKPVGCFIPDLKFYRN